MFLFFFEKQSYKDVSSLLENFVVAKCSRCHARCHIVEMCIHVSCHSLHDFVTISGSNVNNTALLLRSQAKNKCQPDCANDGVCAYIADDFKCACAPGFTGDFCETGMTYFEVSHC